MKQRRTTQTNFFDQLALGIFVDPEQADQMRASATPRRQTEKTARVVDRNPAGPTSSARNRDSAYHAGQNTKHRLTARERVLRYIRLCGVRGATREEIAEATGIKESSVCGRVDELLRPADPLQKPLIRQTGERRKGPSPGSGLQVILYAVTQHE